MSKKQSSPPKMGNNGGTAYVRINGERIYLGKFGSPESKQNYARCIAEWAVSNTSPDQAAQPVGTITVNSLALAFLSHVQESGMADYHAFRSAIKGLLQLYSGIAVDSFTPKCLTAVQLQFTRHIDKNGKQRSRQYCNTLVNRLKRMFRWGVAQELVSPVTADTSLLKVCLKKTFGNADSNFRHFSPTVHATDPIFLC